MRISLSRYQEYYIFVIIFLFLFRAPLIIAEDTIDEARTNEYATAFWNSFNNDLANGALEKYLTHWDENAERITPTVHARGFEEIRATYKSYLAAYSDFHQQEIRRIVDGNISISELITTAKNRATGEMMTLPNVAIVELNDKGKVIRARVYLDTGKFNPKPLPPEK